MLFKKSPEKFWNLIASKYAASPISDMAAYKTKVDKIKTWLHSEDIVLDIGCGTGTQCDDIADSVEHVTGIDISRKLLSIAEQRKAERKLQNVEFIQTSVFEKHFQPGSFDVVMAFHVLHLIEDTDAVLKCIHELLKPGGLFISETVCIAEKSRIMGKMLRFAGHLGLLPLINLFTTQQLEQELEKHDFTVIDKIKFSDKADAEYTLFARKY